MKDADALAADLSDPDLFELWIASDTDDTFEEWAEKRRGVQSAFPSGIVVCRNNYRSSGHVASLTVEPGGIYYSVEPIR